MTILVLAKFNFNLSDAARRGRRRERQGRGLPAARACATASRTGRDQEAATSSSPRPRPGARHRGPAAHPDPLLHGARRPRPPGSRCNWAIGLIGTFYLMTLALGFGAAALVGPESDHGRQPRRQHGGAAARRGARRRSGPTGGGDLLAVIAAVAFATILAVVAGLTLASSSSLGARHLRQRHPQGEGHREAGGAGRPDRGGRASAPSSIALAIFAAEPQRRRSWSRWPSRSPRPPTCRRSSTACSGSGSTPRARPGRSTAGSAWRCSWCSSRRWSPAVPTAMFPDDDFPWFPLENPGIISIPVGFFFGWLGTVLSRSRTPPSTPSWRSGP